MKKLLFYLLVTVAIVPITSVITYADSDFSLFYMLKADVNLHECNADGDETGFTVKTAPSGSKFTIVKITDNDYIIRFWKWNVSGISNVLNKISAGQSLSNKENALVERQRLSDELNFDISKPATTLRFFKIPKSSLEIFAVKLVSKMSPTFGAAVLPFKFRPQQGGDFTKDLSISNMGGIRFSNSTGKHSLSVLVGIGIASVSLDSINTNGKITDAQDRAAITLPLGVVYQWERLQIGLFGGWDWLSRRNVDNWNYQGKPWLSLGIGVSLFTEDNVKKNEGGQ